MRFMGILALGGVGVACSGTTSAPSTSPAGAQEAARDVSGWQLSAEGVGPFRLGMSGAALLAMKGAERREPDCPCEYTVRFADVGVSVQVGAGTERACGIWIDDPATVGAQGTVGALGKVYGAPWIEPATGDVRFTEAMWLAASVGPVEGEALQGTEPVRALLVGGCGE